MNNFEGKWLTMATCGQYSCWFTLYCLHIDLSKLVYQSRLRKCLLFQLKYITQLKHVEKYLPRCTVFKCTFLYYFLNFFLENVWLDNRCSLYIRTLWNNFYKRHHCFFFDHDALSIKTWKNSKFLLLWLICTFFKQF